MTPVLSATGVVAGYGGADEILKGVDFSIAPGEIACIIGPNGAGKSTLLKAIAGLLIPKHGTVALAGDDITGQLPRDIARRGLAYVPQEHNIFATLSVRENLEMGSYLETDGIASIWRSPPESVRAAWRRLLPSTGKRAKACAMRASMPSVSR